MEKSLFVTEEVILLHITLSHAHPLRCRLTKIVSKFLVIRAYLMGIQLGKMSCITVNLTFFS